jgi:ABC-type amino acid transport substrate-binding protein
MRLLAFIIATLPLAAPVCAGTIDDIKARGVLTCAVEEASPGLSVAKGIGRTGLAIDLCAAFADAVLGNARSTAYVAVTEVDAFAVLQAEEADVLLMARPWRMADEVEQGVVLVQPLMWNETQKKVFGPIIRQGDDSWFVALRWILITLSKAAGLPTNAEIMTELGLKPESLTRSRRFAEILSFHLDGLEGQGFHPATSPNLTE